MKNHDVVGYVSEGEVVCSFCASTKDIQEGEPIFAGSCPEDEVCAECGEKLLEDLG